MICIIDLDGTLINSAKRHYVLMEELISRLAPEVEFQAQEFMDYKADGNSGKRYLVEELGLPDELADRIMREWGRHIEDVEYLAMDELYADALPFLDSRKKAKDKIFYLTARQRKEDVLKELAALQIDKYAAKVIVVNPANAAKEKLAAVQEIEKKARKGTPILVIGDTENEYEMASELALPMAILHRGARSRAYWEKRQVATIGSLLDIVAAPVEDNKKAQGEKHNTKV